MTDYTYALVNSIGYIDNIILTDSNDSIDALKMLFPDVSNIILITDQTGPAYIGGDIVNGKFRMPPTYPSWIWDDVQEVWKTPIEYPQDDKFYIWDESTISWKEVIPPEV